MNLIFAVDKKNSIGKNGKLLTYLPEDLKYYKEKTIGKIIIMGRKTVDSLPGGKLLPDRKTIILTRNKAYQKEGAIILGSVEEVVDYLLENEYSSSDVFVSGGAEIYRQFLKYCSTAYVTEIDFDFGGDTFVFDIKNTEDWYLFEEGEIIEHSGYTYRHNVYKKIK